MHVGCVCDILVNTHTYEYAQAAECQQKKPHCCEDGVQQRGVPGRALALPPCTGNTHRNNLKHTLGHICTCSCFSGSWLEMHSCVSNCQAPRTGALNQQEDLLIADFDSVRAVPLPVGELPPVDPRVGVPQLGHGHIDLRGVQSSRDVQTPPALEDDPEPGSLSHGQQGGLALGTAVVQVQAGEGGPGPLRGTREPHQLALCPLNKDHLCPGWWTQEGEMCQ